MVGLVTARRLALALPETAEQDHHGIWSYRVRGKIFATVPDDGHLHVMLAEDETRAAVRAHPDACEEMYWGKKLAGVRVRLAQIGEGALGALLETAWRRKAPKTLVRERDERA